MSVNNDLDLHHIDPETGKRRVSVLVCVRRIRQMEPRHSLAWMHLHMRAKWREPKLDGTKGQEVKGLDKMWNPQIQPENACTEMKGSFAYYHVDYDEEGRAFVVELRVFRGPLVSHFDLRHFPFDYQRIHIILKSEKTSNDLEFVAPPDEPSVIAQPVFETLLDWHVTKYLDVDMKHMVDELTQKKHPAYHGELYVVRKMSYYIWNYFLIMFLITCFIPLTFLVELLGSVHVRLTLAFTLTLTGLSMKFVISNSIPRVPYLTLIDRYILLILISNWGATTWHAGTYLISDDQLRHTVDLAMTIFCFSAFVLVHLLYYAWLYVTFTSHMTTLKKLNEKHEKKYGDKVNKSADVMTAKYDSKEETVEIKTKL